jgi:hypothetical protein
LDRLAANPLAQASISLELFAFVGWMVFVGYVAWRVRAAGWLAAVVLVGGITQIAVKLGSLAPLISAYVLRDEIPPELAFVLTHMAQASFKIDLLPAGLFVLAAAIAALNAHQMGRVLAWTGIVAGVANIVVASVTGVNVGQAPFVPSFLLIMFWVFAVSLVWGFARSRAKAPAAVTSAVGVKGAE